MTVANVSANKISTIPRQFHPAAITQMVMDGLRCPLGDATQSERGQRLSLLIIIMLTNNLIHSSIHTLLCTHCTQGR